MPQSEIFLPPHNRGIPLNLCKQETGLAFFVEFYSSLKTPDMIFGGQSLRISASWLDGQLKTGYLFRCRYET